MTLVIHEAVNSGKLDIAENLISYGADLIHLNNVDGQGQSTTARRITSSKIRCCGRGREYPEQSIAGSTSRNLLIGRGANLDTLYRHGESLLPKALGLGKFDIADLLFL
jgi:hypothetical protein